MSEDLSLDKAFYMVRALHTLGKPRSEFAKYECVLRHDASFAFRYARLVLKARWPEAEPLIMQSPIAGEYAIELMKDRWLEAEPYMIRQARSAYMYSLNILKTRWPEAEHAILDSQYNIPYARDVIMGRWPALECKLLSMTGRFTERENALSLFRECERYRHKVVRGRWLEYEQKLLAKVATNSSLHKLAEMYIHNVIRGRWEDAEHVFLKNKRSKLAKLYLTWVTKATLNSMGLPEHNLGVDEITSVLD